MKVVSRYCDSCGVKIPASDIEEQIALKYEESYYCKDCKTEVMPLLDKKGGKNNGSAAAATAAAAKAAGKTPAPSKGDKANGTERPSRPGVPTRPGAAKPGAAAAKKPLPARPGAKPLAAAKPALGKKPAPRPRDEEDEDSGDDDGSEEELDAQEEKKGLPVVPIAIGGGVLVLIIVVVLLMRGGGTDSSGASTAAGSKDTKPVSAATALKRDSEKYWADAKARVAGKPLGQQAKELRGIYEANDKWDPQVAAAVDAELEAMDAELNKQGKEAYEGLSGRAREQAEVAAFDEAIATLRTFPEELRESQWWKNATIEIGRYEKQLAAKSEADPLERKAREYANNKDYYVAIGVLEGFDTTEFGSSKFAERLDGLKRQFEEVAAEAERSAALGEAERKEKEARDKEIAEKRAKKQKDFDKVASANWTQIPTDDLFTWKTPEPLPKDGWKCQGKELVGKSGSGLQQYNNRLGGAAGSGNKAWVDYILQFRYKVVKGNFKVGVRATDSAFVELEPETLNDGQWHAMEIQVYGSENDAFQQIVDGVAKTIKFDAHDSSAGGVAFCLMPNSEVVFTEVRVKVINKQ